jgi:redox-sensitive bicupin YhaK (pirin superfamily)
MWHGKEFPAGDVPHIQGFQLWIALPPDIENSAPVCRRTLDLCAS